MRPLRDPVHTINPLAATRYTFYSYVESDNTLQYNITTIIIEDNTLCVTEKSLRLIISTCPSIVIDTITYVDVVSNICDENKRLCVS